MVEGSEPKALRDSTCCTYTVEGRTRRRFCTDLAQTIYSNLGKRHGQRCLDSQMKPKLLARRRGIFIILRTKEARCRGVSQAMQSRIGPRFRCRFPLLAVGCST